MLYKYLREYLKIYSFIKDVKLKGTYVFIYYKDGEITKFKKLSYRSTKEILIKTIEDIKKEIKYYENKEKISTKVDDMVGGF